MKRIETMKTGPERIVLKSAAAAAFVTVAVLPGLDNSAKGYYEATYCSWDLLRFFSFFSAAALIFVAFALPPLKRAFSVNVSPRDERVGDSYILRICVLAAALCYTAGFLYALAPFFFPSCVDAPPFSSLSPAESVSLRLRVLAVPVAANSLVTAAALDFAARRAQGGRLKTAYSVALSVACALCAVPLVLFVCLLINGVRLGGAATQPRLAAFAFAAAELAFFAAVAVRAFAQRAKPLAAAFAVFASLVAAADIYWLFVHS